MKNSKRATLLLLVALVSGSMAAQKYKVRSIAWERLEVTSALDANPDQRAMEIVKPYKARVDSTMMPVLGLSAWPWLQADLRVCWATGRPTYWWREAPPPDWSGPTWD